MLPAKPQRSCQNRNTPVSQPKRLIEWPKSIKGEIRYRQPPRQIAYNLLNFAYSLGTFLQGYELDLGSPPRDRRPSSNATIFRGYGGFLS